VYRTNAGTLACTVCVMIHNKKMLDRALVRYTHLGLSDSEVRGHPVGLAVSLAAGGDSTTRRDYPLGSVRLGGPTILSGWLLAWQRAEAIVQRAEIIGHI
jgi:hypothetical protein